MEKLLLLSFVLGTVGALGVYRFGDRFGLMDHPSGRSSHVRVTPKGGGVGILTAFGMLSLVMQISWLFWLPSILLALLSFLGDRVELSPKLRLALQFFCAFCLLSAIELPLIVLDSLLGSLVPKAIGGIVLWGIGGIYIVGTANFYNFMDGINGIAAISGLIAFGFLGIVTRFLGGDAGLGILAFGLSAACLGFLPLNIPQAKVFMGDVGSILLGFVFAGLVLWIAKDLTDLACYAGFLFPFYADELITMGKRIRDKESLTKPHRKHLYQILANEGQIAHWKISLSYGAVQVLMSSLFLLARPYGLLPVLSIWVTASFIFFFSSLYLNKRYSLLSV